MFTPRELRALLVLAKCANTGKASTITRHVAERIVIAAEIHIRIIASIQPIQTCPKSRLRMMTNLHMNWNWLPSVKKPRQLQVPEHSVQSLEKSRRLPATAPSKASCSIVADAPMTTRPKIAKPKNADDVVSTISLISGLHVDSRLRINKFQTCHKCGSIHGKKTSCAKAANQRAEREAARQTSIQQFPQQDEGSANATDKTEGNDVAMAANTTSKTEGNDIGMAANATRKIEGNNIGKSTADDQSSEKQCSQCGYVHKGACKTPFCHHCCSFHTIRINCFEARTIRAQRDAFYAAKEGNPEARAEPHTEPRAQIQSPQPQTLPGLQGPQGQTQHDNSLYAETLKFFYERDGPEGALNFYARFGAGRQFQLPVRPSPQTSVTRSIEESMVQPTPTDHNIAKQRQSPGNDSTDWGTDYTSESEDEEERDSPKAVPKAKRRRLDKEDDDGLSTLRRERKRKTTKPSPKAKRSEAKMVQRTNKRKHESEDELEDQEPKRRKSGKESQPVKRKSQAMTKTKQPIKRKPESDSSHSSDSYSSDDELPPPKPTKAKQPIKRAPKSDSSNSSDSESSDDKPMPPKPTKAKQPIKRAPESDSSDSSESESSDDEPTPPKLTKAKQPIKRVPESNSSDSSDSESSDDESNPPKPKKLKVQDSRPKVAAKKSKREAEQKAEKKPKKVAVVTIKTPAKEGNKKTEKTHGKKKSKKHK
ncbi:hypothetical protein BC567DRAFT_275660 [Phyllosticta citribraziliensis]